MSGDWSIVALGSVLTDIQPGFASGRHNTEGEGTPHFRPMNVSTDGRIERSVMKYVDPAAGRPDVRLAAGDILFNNTNSPELVGKTALFEDNDSPAFSNHMTRLRVDDTQLDARYAALRLHQAWREGWFAAHCNNHVSQASISRDVLKSLEIELPPLEVQRAIASLNAVVDRSRSSASTHLLCARQAIERLCDAVLTSAYSGRLTAEWRSTLTEPAESATAHLRCLQQSRLGAVKKQPLAPFVDFEDAELSEGWRWASADELTVLITKGTTPPAADMSQADGEIPYLKVYNLTFDGAVNFTVNPTFVPRAVHDSLLKRSRVFPGDLLLNIVGPPLGKVGVVPKSHAEWNINQAIAVLRPVTGVNSEFLKLWLLSPQLLSHLIRRAKATSGQYNLTLQICRELPVPFPPPAEQAEIVKRVNELLALGDTLITRIDAATKRVDRSSQVVLAKAFRGDLTGPSS